MSEAAPTFVRWLWIWITIGALVVVVVVGFLLGIVSSLESIDKGLFSADRDVASIQGETKPLPTYVSNINNNLTQIDKALKPIPGQGLAILRALRSIQGTLTSVDRSLIDTSASLVDTSGRLGNITGQLVSTSGTLQIVSRSLVDTAGSLVNTSNALVTVRSLVSRISNTLIQAERGGSSAGGTNAIWRRVRFLNGGSFRRSAGTSDNDTSLAGPGQNASGLTPVETDARNILGGLVEVNKHLTSICTAPLLVSGVVIPGVVQANGP